MTCILTRNLDEGITIPIMFSELSKKVIKEKRNLYKILIKKSEGTKPLGRPTYK
jgi:hypothetical protein